MPIVKPKQKSFSDRLTDFLYAFALIFVIFVTIYPFWHVIMYSFSDSRAAMTGGLFFWPRKPSIQTYTMLFETKRVFVAFGNSLAKTLVGTSLSMVITTLTAYALSLNELKGRRFFQLMIYFTMLFNGGMIPTYILVKNLGLIDNFWVYVFPGAMSAYNMFVLRNFFKTLPKSLSESAMLDGANHLQILWNIVVPLSKAGLATIAVYYVRTNWNSYMDGVLYVNETRLELLQVYLRRLISAAGAKSALSEMADLSNALSVTEESMKMTVIAISIIPVILVYLFLQKFFIKGTTVGAVKG